MLSNIIILFIVLITLVIFLQYSVKDRESFIGNSGGIPVSGHQDYVESSKQKFNQFANLINLTDPSMTIGPSTRGDIDIALQTVNVVPTSGAYSINSASNNNNIPNDVPSTYTLAAACEAKNTDCSAFDDPTFAQNCGISFDPKGKSFTGKPHIGGKFISEADRAQQLPQIAQLDAAGQDGLKALKPTLGTSKPGTFAITKDQCTVIKERVECEHKQTFSSPNCTECYTSQNFHRVGPETGRLPSTLNLFGNGIIEIDSTRFELRKGQVVLDPQSAYSINVPSDAEGNTFTINVSPNPSDTSGKPPYILGYITGQTPRGTFNLDLMSLIDVDHVTSARPKLGGANIVNGFRAFIIIPGAGKKTMALGSMIPFSFLSLYDGDARTCDNGPVITQAASATFLESDPCFGRKNKPGNYTMACLQERWVELGGAAQGTGYPNTQDKANAIQIDSNGNPLDIDTIVNNLYPQMVQANTGLNADGSYMTIPQWNTVSMWGLGIPINTPCDGAGQESGQVLGECLEYLYLNQGAQSHIGATYSLPTTDSSLIGSTNGSNIYCQPGAPLDPSTSTGKQIIQTASQNGVAAVKSVYDSIHRMANDNTQDNSTRSTAINQCYGVTLDTMNAAPSYGPTQVYSVGPNYQYTHDQAASVCSNYGGSVATIAQLQDAYANGADWCSAGMVADDTNNGYYPIQIARQGCGSGSGVQQYGLGWAPNTDGTNAHLSGNGNPATAMMAVNCYGPKPTSSLGGVIQPFNQSSWDQTTDNYVVTTGGYLETSGPQPGCFSNLSVSQAQAQCDNMGSSCAGFSFNGGNGCFKGDVKGGLYTGNPGYIGYVKKSVCPSGTYIYGQNQGGFCCPVQPTSMDSTGEYTSCPGNVGICSIGLNTQGNPPC
jgi:hypothetical protein